MIDQSQIVLSMMLALFSDATLPGPQGDNLPPAIATVGDGQGRSGPGVWQVVGGMRLTLVRDPGLDPFATDDAVPQLSLAGMRSFLGQSAAVAYPAVGVLWEYGARPGQARGVDTRLSLHRLALVLEERWAPARHLYFAGRLSPGIVLGSATLSDPSSPVSFGDSFESLSLDASAVAALRVTPERSVLGLWAVVEAGYGWSQRRDLVLTPDLEEADRDKAGATPLGSIALRGPFMRLALAVSY